MSLRHLLGTAAVVLFAAGGCAGDPTRLAEPTPAPAPAATVPGAVPRQPHPDDGRYTETDHAPEGVLTAEQPSVEPQPRPGAGRSAAGEITITGVVRAGVEQGCLVLRVDEQEYLLITENGDDRTPRVGQHVTVTGRTRPDLVTTCMQGIPLLISEIQVH